MVLSEGIAVAPEILASKDSLSGKENNEPLENKNMEGSDPTKHVSVLVPQKQLTRCHAQLIEQDPGWQCADERGHRFGLARSPSNPPEQPACLTPTNLNPACLKTLGKLNKSLPIS